MKGFKRLISIALSAIMLLSAFPITAFAAEERADACGENDTVVWIYTAATDTLYINTKSKTRLKEYDNPFTYLKEEHYLPTTYIENGQECFWNEPFSRLVIGNNVTTIGGVYLGYDYDTRFYPYPELAEVEFEENSSLIVVDKYNFYKSPITHIELPASTCTIRDFAFSESNIESIVVPQNVDRINQSAFAGCKYLTSVVINGTINNVAISLFENCNRLSQVVLPDTVTTICRKAFLNCSALCTLQLPDGLTTIDGYAFSGSGINSIEIPSGVKLIDDYAFKDAKIKHITLNEGLEKIGINAFENSWLEEIALPSTTIKVGIKAFFNCARLTTASLPEVATIEAYAFNKCTSLHTFSAPKATVVNTYAFAQTPLLEDITMPKLRAVYQMGFYDSGITAISFASPSSSNIEVNIGEGAFMGCSNLVSVRLPADVRVINRSAFQACSRLKSIVIPEYTNTICSKAFDATPITMITILSRGCNIDSNAFGEFDASLSIRGYLGSTAEAYANDNSITFIPIDEVVTGGEDGEITVPDEPYEPTAAEINANKLKGTWSNGVWKITGNSIYISGEGEMNDCTAVDYNGDSTTFAELCNANGVYNMYINEGITTLADYFLYLDEGCIVEKAFVPNTLEKIGKYAFANSGIVALYPNKPIFEMLGTSNPFMVFPYSVKEIGEYAFAECKRLNAVVMLPIDLTVVREGLFYNSAIKNAEAYGYVESIEKKAFAGCNNLLSLAVPCSASIYVDNDNPENNSFGYDDNRVVASTNIYCREDSEAYRYAQANGIPTTISHGVAYASGRMSTSYKKSIYTYNYSLFWSYYPEDKSLTIRKGTKDDGSSLLKKSFDDKIIAENEDAFVSIEENSMIRNLIEKGSFSTAYRDYDYGSVAVDKIIVDEGITEVSCSDLFAAFNPKQIILPESATSLQYHAFRGCSRLETVYLPQSITSIEDDAFADCYELVGVNLGGVTKIDDSMFENRKKLRIVHMNNVRTIGDKAFSRCVELEEIVLPDATVSVGTRAFFKCIKAQEIRLGSGLTAIGENAFDDLAYCERVYINSNLSADTARGGFRDIGTSTTGVDLIYGNGVNLADLAVFENTRVTGINLGSGISTVTGTQYLPYAQEISVDGANSNYAVNQNILYSKNGKTLVYSPAKQSDVSIADGVEAISDYALFGTSAVSVVVPSSVAALGKYAFANAKALKNVDIQRGVEVLSEGCFEGCTALRSFYSPSSIRTVGDKAFKNCTRLSSVILPTRLNSIGAEAFMGCMSLIGMVVGEDTASIGDRAYKDCIGLEEIYIWYDTTIGENAFDNDDSLTIHTMAGSDAYRYARENGVAYSAYTDEDCFYDLCGDKLDVYAGYLGFCSDGHGDIEWLTVYSADCENDGYMIGVCEYCSEILDERHINAYHHDYRLTTKIPSTATTRGMKVYTCLNCGEANCEYIEPSGEDMQVETHSVSGSVVLALNKDAEGGKSPARNVSIVIDDMVVAKTDENGEFNLRLETGTYEARLVYAYGFTRTIYIVVEDEDLVSEPIAIIGCDFNKDGKIDNDDLALSKMVISSTANDLSYLDYVDMNNDGYINAKDMVYILSCKGIDSATYSYSEIIIQK